MKYAKRRTPRPRRPKYSLAQLLSQMPEVGLDEDFARSNDDFRAWDEMIPVGREFGAANSKSRK